MKLLLASFLLTYAVSSVRSYVDEYANDRALLCVESFISSYQNDSSEQNVCRKLNSFDCLRDAVDDCKEHDIENDETVISLLREEGWNASYVNYVFNLSGIDEEGMEEIGTCIVENRQYTHICLFLGSFEEWYSLNRKYMPFDALQCKEYAISKMRAACYTERVREKCGDKAERFVDAKLSKKPRYITESCDVAGEIIKMNRRIFAQYAAKGWLPEGMVWDSYLVPADKFIRSFAMECTVITPDEPVERLIETILGDSSEREKCRELRKLVKCVKDAVEKYSYFDEEAEVEKDLQYIEKQFSESCKSDRSIEEALNGFDEEKINETAGCLHAISFDIAMCYFERNLGRQDLDKHAFECAMYNLTTDCHLKTVTRECGETAGRIVAIVKSESRKEFIESCKAAGEMENQSIVFPDE